jgi:hypothetical protein
MPHSWMTAHIPSSNSPLTTSTAAAAMEGFVPVVVLFFLSLVVCLAIEWSNGGFTSVTTNDSSWSEISTTFNHQNKRCCRFPSPVPALSADGCLMLANSSAANPLSFMTNCKKFVPKVRHYKAESAVRAHIEKGRLVDVY